MKFMTESIKSNNSKVGLRIAEGTGFTLLEVLISLAIIGGLLITLIYTLNYQLGIAERHGVITVATNLAKEKLYEMESNPSASSGRFEEPFSGFTYETVTGESIFPGMMEIGVVVRNGKDVVRLSRLIESAR